MKKEDVISIFFSRSFEKQLNEKILDDIDYVVDVYGVLNYVANVIDVPYADFLKYISEHPFKAPLQSANITQSSCFAACETEMIDVFLSEDNKGLEFINIGRHFTKYVRSNKDAAFRKYGENQVKTAAQLGLAFEYYKHWYLNSVGYVYNELGKEDRMSLLARNILREPLYATMLSDIQYHDIDIVSYMDCLDSDETKARRYENVKFLLDICLNECKKEGVKTFKVLNTKEGLLKNIKEKKKKNKTAHIISQDIFSYSQVSFESDKSEAMAAESNRHLFVEYLKKMTSLRCYKKKGKPAPYKAIMLLSVMDLLDNGIIKDNRIMVSPELRKKYRELSISLDYDRTLFNPPFELPFIHLSGDGFWHIKLRNQSDNKRKATYNLNEIEYAYLDDDLYSFFQDLEKRTILRNALINTYMESNIIRKF